MNLFEIIQDLCKRENITIAALERALGFGNATIKKWSVAIPSGDRLAKVADYFNVTTDYLLGREQSDKRSQEEIKTFDEMIKVYTRSKNKLSPQEKMRLAQIILSDEE